jgi:Flp pilus assembly protein TadD
MAKTPVRKPANRPAAKAERPDFFQNVSLQGWLLFGLAFLLYANTLRHGFVLDDGIVITENTFTQQGIAGIGGILSHDTFYGFVQQEGQETVVAGGRYRPLSLVLFALLYQIAGAAPFLYHLVTVLLFAFTCMVLYRTFLRLLAPEGPATGTANTVAWLATALFAVHPVHTEVVANIKSCDEIMALLGSLGALYYALKAWDTGVRKWAILAGICFFLACLSKENAIAYAVLIPLAGWFFRGNDRMAAGTNLWSVSAPILVAVVGFLALRGSVLPWGAMVGAADPVEVLNNPFLKHENGQWVAFSFAEKFATIFYTLFLYLKLLVLPHPLTHDYYPRHIDIMSFGHPAVLLGLALYGALAFLAFRGLQRRDPMAFGILLYLLPLGIVSNLVFPVGTNMSERFLFMPSVGFCLAMAWVLNRFLPAKQSAVLGGFALVALLFAGKTIARNFVWKSNETLFLNDVAISENSIKLRLACAKLLADRAKTEPADRQRNTAQEALGHVNKAMALYPDFVTGHIVRAEAYAAMQQFPEAIADYRRALQLQPDDPKRKTMLAFMLREAGKYQGQQKKDLAGALKYLNEAWQTDTTDPETARLLGVAYMVQGNLAEAESWYQRSEALAPNDAVALWELSMSYGNLGKYPKADELQKRALAIDPKIAQKAAAGQQ